MTDLRTKTVCHVDQGLFTHVTEMLTRHFGRVLLHNPTWKTEFASSNRVYIGDGIPGVERVEDFWDIKDDVDLFVFSDILYGDWQDELVRQGKRVWGSRRADELELNRWEFKQDILKGELNMPVQPMQKIIGLPKLREFLKNPKNSPKYIKISQTRGDMESRKHINYAISRSWMDELAHRFGPLVDDMEFIVEDPIDATIEVGYDGYNIDGKYPDPAICGYEVKDAGYIGTVLPYSKLPDPLRYVNDKMAPVLKTYGYRGNLSTEIRVGKDGKYYYIDPCCREGSPPSQVLCELISNWGEIMWEGADGKLVAPVAAAKYGIQAFIYSERCDKHWTCYSFPKQLKRWFKFSYLCMIDGNTYTIPQNLGMSAMGSIVAIDDDLTGAIGKLVEYNDKLEGDGLDVRIDSLPKAVKEIHDAEKLNYSFGDGKIPTVSEIAEMVI